MMESSTSESGTSFEVPADPDPVYDGTRTISGLRCWERLFLLVSFINIVITIGLTIWRLVVVVHIDDNPKSTDVTFAIVLLINSVFCAFYVTHGVVRELKFELFAFIGAVCVVTGYCVIEYVQHFNARNDIKLIRLIATLILAPVNIGLAYMAARDFGFLAFRVVGASEMLQRMYVQTEIFTCLLKFDVQVAVSFIVLVMRNGTQLDTGQTIILVIGIPYTLLLALLAWVAMRKELRTLMWTFDLFALVSPAFVIYRVVMVYTKSEDFDMLDYSILAAGALAIVIRAMILVETVIISQNFNYGLKEIAFTPHDTNHARSLLYGIHVRRDGSILRDDDT